MLKQMDQQPNVSALTQTTWDCLPFLQASAARQMAIDATMVRLCGTDTPRAIFRVYRMDPPGVTIGRHQRWRSVIDEAECRRRGWEWARRPTGGGALLHRGEINYAVAASHAVFGADASFRHAYHCIMRGLAEAVGLLGGHPTLHMGRSAAPSGPARSANGLCEQSLTQYEIAVDGKKAVAAAQWYLADAVLQHGTIYLQAPQRDDRFWPLDARSARLSISHTPVWWNISAPAEPMEDGTRRVVAAVRDGMARALHLTWSEIGYDQIAPALVHAQLRDWDKQNWNRHR
jgi:lipoate-protein ligase A